MDVDVPEREPPLPPPAPIKLPCVSDMGLPKFGSLDDIAATLDFKRPRPVFAPAAPPQLLHQAPAYNTRSRARLFAAVPCGRARVPCYRW